MAEEVDFTIVEYAEKGRTDPIQFRADVETETIWATQAQIAELFTTKQQNVSYHLKNIFAEGELDPVSNTKKFGIAGDLRPVSSSSLK